MLQANHLFVNLLHPQVALPGGSYYKCLWSTATVSMYLQAPRWFRQHPCRRLRRREPRTGRWARRSSPAAGRWSPRFVRRWIEFPGPWPTSSSCPRPSGHLRTTTYRKRGFNVYTVHRVYKKPNSQGYGDEVSEWNYCLVRNNENTSWAKLYQRQLW